MTSSSSVPATTASSPRILEAIERVEEICGQLAPHPTVLELCPQLLEPMVEGFEGARGSMLLLNPDTGRLQVVAGVGIPPEVIGRDVTPRPRSISDWVMREGRGIILNGEIKDQRFEASAPRAGIGSALSVPLVGTHGAIGTLNLARLSPAPNFTEADQATAERFARPLASAIERLEQSRLVEESRRQLAAVAMPGSHRANAMLELPNFQLAFALEASQRVGGDLFDRVPHPAGGQILLIADVSGDGPGALAAGALVRGLFVGLACADRTPVEIVSRMNAELHQRLGEGSYAALWVGLASPNGSLVYCNAGYPPPLWIPAGGEDLQRLGTGGPVAGAFTSSRFEQESLRLLPGDTLLAASDGALFARNGNDETFGWQRLRELALDQQYQPPDRQVTAVCTSAREFAGRSKPFDDLAVFALRYTRSG